MRIGLDFDETDNPCPTKPDKCSATQGKGWSGGHHCKLLSGHVGPHICGDYSSDWKQNYECNYEWDSKEVLCSDGKTKNTASLTACHGCHLRRDDGRCRRPKRAWDMGVAGKDCKK